MAGYFLFNFILSIVFVASSALRIEEHCDFQFGDPNWGISKVIYDRASWFPEGQDKWNIFLPKDKGMISFICVKVSGDYKKMMRVQYSPIFHKLTLKLDQPAPKQFLFHVKAKAHGY